MECCGGGESIPGVPPYAILCPGQSEAEYCDCSYDCNANPAFCSCPDAMSCCLGLGYDYDYNYHPGGPIEPPHDYHYHTGIPGVPPDAILCPGQSEEDYCDCGYDCHTNFEWCSCPEAMECCMNSHPPEGIEKSDHGNNRISVA